VLVILACARVYAGVHYPTDVAAGIVAGAAWALAVSAVLA
jgi:undecaprenyl-diphosphatase